MRHQKGITEASTFAVTAGLQLCTGWGQFDTRKGTSDDYKAITGKEIVAMMRKPPSVAKADAQWFIPSTYKARDGREFAAQRDRGEFWFLCLDEDGETENNLSLDEIDQFLASVCGDVARMIYSTRSSTAGKRKWRALIPLYRPISGTDYADTAAAFNAELIEASAGVLIPDPALERAAQLIYLPNRGEHYEHSATKGNRLDLAPDHRIIRQREGMRAEWRIAEAQAQARRDERQRKAEANPGGTASVVEAFNGNTIVSSELERAGYRASRNCRDWRSPNSSTGSYAVRDFGEFWISLSGSDAALEIGNVSPSGNRIGDAFDLFVHYEHGGDFKAAIRAYAEELDVDHKSKAKAERQDPASVLRGGSHDDGPPPREDKPKAAVEFVAVGDLQYRDPEFIIDGLMETECLGLIFGDPGIGKTFAAIDMALSVASGTPFHGRPVRQGSVFYIAGEGHNGLARRFHAWSRLREVPLASCRMFKSERAAQFLDAASAGAVSEAVEGLAQQVGAPALIVIDTLARNFGAGDENSTQDMNEFIVAIDDLRARFPGSTILIVHHSGHADKQRARGAMALKGALDFEYRVEAAEGVAMQVVNIKMKDAPLAKTMAFNLETVHLGGKAESAVPVATDVLEREHKLTGNQKLALETFKTAAADGLGWKDGTFAGVDLEKWRGAFYAKHTGDTPEAKKKAFQRARKDLQDAGRVTVDNDRYFVHTAGPQMAIVGGRDKRDIAGHPEKCPGAEAGI